MSDRRPLPYGRQDIDEHDVRAVVECLTSDFLTQGPRVAAFESALCAATGARYAVAVANGTAALHLAYLALGIGEGDVGVTSPISFVATSNGLLYAGANVAFADVEHDTGLLSVGVLEETVARLVAAGRAPKVIAPVDLTGQPADRAAVQRIAAACGARVLEDAAHSLGATYTIEGEEFRVGGCAHSDAAILSFHPVKHVTTGEGGAVMTNDPELHRRLLDLRTHGIHKNAERMTRAADDAFVGPWYYEQECLGFNYRISDLQCALGASQMRRLPEMVARRRAIAARYDAALSEGRASARLTPLRHVPGVSSSYHLYVVQLRGRPGESSRDLAARRKELFLGLRSRGIGCQVHYIPIPWQPFYQGNPRVEVGSLSGAERYYASSISVPMFPAMSDADVDRVVEALEETSAE